MMILLSRFDGLGHTLFGLVLMLPFIALGFVWTGYLFQCAWWFSRERRDYEIHALIDPHREWYLGWNVFKWSQRDLWCPVVVNGVLAAVVSYVL